MARIPRLSIRPVAEFLPLSRAKGLTTRLYSTAYLSP
jgi:hypothetical protein